MRRRLPSLNALKAFEASARNLSFTVAANELNVTQSAVSRHVRTLEAEIGVTLFVRSVRRLDLTDEGRVLYEGVRTSFDHLEHSVGCVDRRQAEGVLTISALPTFAMNWLMPRLEDFSSTNPSIEVHLLTGIDAVDFSRDDTDIAIRVGNIRGVDPCQKSARIDLEMTKSPKDWRAHRLMADELVAVGSPEFREAAGAISDPGTLVEHRLLHVATRANAWPDYLAALGVTEVIAIDGPKFGHYFMVLEAARRGDGIAVVPQVLVEDDLASGRLVKMVDETVRSDGDYYLLCRENQWQRPPIKAFRTWIARQANAYAGA